MSHGRPDHWGGGRGADRYGRDPSGVERARAVVDGLTQADRIRIGDRERDQAVEALSEHFAAGRITYEEFGERSDLVGRALTRRDLAPAFADLPGGVQRVVGPAAERPRPGGPRRGPRGLLLALAIALLVSVVAGLLGLKVPVFPLFLLVAAGFWLTRPLRRGPSR